MMAEELVKHRRTEAAVPFYERAVEQDPAQPVYYTRLGVAHFRGRRYQQSRETFERGLARFPDDGSLNYLAGYAARAEGEFDLAAKYFRRAVELQPDNAPAYASLGFLTGERGQHEEAERLLRRALALDPQNFPATYDLGRLLVRLKRYADALPVLERGVRLGTRDPGIHYQLFLAYSRLGRKADADRELANFKRMDEARKAADALAPGAKPTEEELPPPETGAPPKAGPAGRPPAR
jgi:tetratricopeptide (TPR) repeat protein